jgi:exopolyphosphatase/guanosine-5'-triphosphate,3'-diphosphate pyrophosphatase
VNAPARRLAAIDIGTVTTRLLIADVSEGSVAEVARRTDITHLGEGLTETGALAPVAMARVRDVVAEYTALAAQHRVSRVSAVATSASRDASNGGELLGMLAEAGVRPQIISGEREAHLTFLGATHGLDGPGVLVDDIGGGSTELVLGDALSTGPRVEFARSVDVGSSRLTELFFRHDPPAPDELARARAMVVGLFEEHLAPVAPRVRTVVSVAGTATSLVAVHLRLDPYDAGRVHGYRLGRAVVGDLLGSLASMTLEERRELVGLHPGRAGVIVAGTLVLDALLGLLDADSTLVSERDILYGILLDTYENTDA